ncbi:MAG TPA: spore germination protein GerW family protein [Terriglobales bacterium]|nr:spore germination protein GerW family protein [Terriglobales bacterium]
MSSLALMQSLHENLSSRAQVRSVFGDPVAAGEKTIIPVAKIAYGFGAGAGTGGVGDTRAKGEGGGGGGGVRAIPVGVFEVGPQGTRFVAVHDRKKQLATLFLGATLGVLLFRRRGR